MYCKVKIEYNFSHDYFRIDQQYVHTYLYDHCVLNTSLGK